MGSESICVGDYLQAGDPVTPERRQALEGLRDKLKGQVDPIKSLLESVEKELAAHPLPPEEPGFDYPKLVPVRQLDEDGV